MPDRLVLRDYSRSRAFLIATSNYEFLPRVPAAKYSIQRMQRLLTGPLCGWPRDRLLVATNEQRPGDLPDRLITAFDDVNDVALFYFVGHGQIASDNQLCLGLTRSRTDTKRRASTSLEFADVRQALLGSNAAVKIVILDCCFAGLATRPGLAGTASEVLDLTFGTGAYTMAATGAYTTAWYEDDPKLNRPQTFFTKYLADLVEQGIPGQPSLLRLDPLFRHLTERLVADNRPAPSKRAIDDAREFAFAHNAAPPHTHVDTHEEVARLTKLLTEARTEVQVLEADRARREEEVAKLTKLLTEARTDAQALDAGRARREEQRARITEQKATGQTGQQPVRSPIRKTLNMTPHPNQRPELRPNWWKPATVSVYMPEMGDAILEGTVDRWLRREGEYVRSSEPIADVSSVMMDFELTADATGVLHILVDEDVDVRIGTRIAEIDTTVDPPLQFRY